LPFISLVLFHLFVFLFLISVDIISLVTVALAAALAHVAALEAKLKTLTEALKDANTAKVSAEKAAKEAEARAKKAEKALAEANQKQSKWEQAVVVQLDEISTSVGSKCFTLSLSFGKVSSVDILCLSYLYFCDAAEKIGEVWRLQQGNSKDPLLDAVDVLESNWKLARDILQRTRHVLIHMFVRLFPKKRDEMPAENLWKLVAAFDTIEDPVLAMKLTSVKRGVKGMIALAQSHGEEVDWEKVGSSYACPLAEMKEFFKKAKVYAPKLVSLILPAQTPSTTARGTSAPSLSTPDHARSAPTDSAVATEVA
jgi:hypothetical protein